MDKMDIDAVKERYAGLRDDVTGEFASLLAEAAEQAYAEHENRGGRGSWDPTTVTYACFASGANGTDIGRIASDPRLGDMLLSILGWVSQRVTQADATTDPRSERIADVLLVRHGRRVAEARLRAVACSLRHDRRTIDRECDALSPVKVELGVGDYVITGMAMPEGEASPDGSLPSPICAKEIRWNDDGEFNLVDHDYDPGRDNNRWLARGFPSNRTVIACHGASVCVFSLDELERAGVSVSPSDSVTLRGFKGTVTLDTAWGDGRGIDDYRPLEALGATDSGCRLPGLLCRGLDGMGGLHTTIEIEGRIAETGEEVSWHHDRRVDYAVL